jgi:hypothetical protein
MRLQSQSKLPIFPQRGKRLRAFARALNDSIKNRGRCFIIFDETAKIAKWRCVARSKTTVKGALGEDPLAAAIAKLFPAKSLESFAD